MNRGAEACPGGRRARCCCTLSSARVPRAPSFTSSTRLAALRAARPALAPHVGRRCKGSCARRIERIERIAVARTAFLLSHRRGQRAPPPTTQRPAVVPAQPQVPNFCIHRAPAWRYARRCNGGRERTPRGRPASPSSLKGRKTLALVAPSDPNGNVNTPPRKHSARPARHLRHCRRMRGEHWCHPPTVHGRPCVPYARDGGGFAGRLRVGLLRHSAAPTRWASARIAEQLASATTTRGARRCRHPRGPRAAGR